MMVRVLATFYVFGGAAGLLAATGITGSGRWVLAALSLCALGCATVAFRWGAGWPRAVFHVPVASAGWTIAHQVAHLAHSEEVARRHRRGAAHRRARASAALGLPSGAGDDRAGGAGGERLHLLDVDTGQPAYGPGGRLPVDPSRRHRHRQRRANAGHLRR